MNEWKEIQRRLTVIWQLIEKHAPPEKYRTQGSGRLAFECLLGRLYFNLVASQDLNDITSPLGTKNDKPAVRRYIGYWDIRVRMKRMYFPNPKNPTGQPLTRLWRAYLGQLNHMEVAAWAEAFKRCHYLQCPHIPGRKQLHPGLPIKECWFQAMETELDEHQQAKARRPTIKGR